MTRPKPDMAAWIARERKRLGLKPADVAAKLSALGLEASEQTVRVWESYANRKPSPDNIDGLERIFGSRSPEAAPVGDQAAVVAAIDRQTVVMTRLCDLIQQTLDRSVGDRERNAIAVSEISLALGRIEETLDPTRSQDGSAGESPADAPRRHR